MTSKSKIVSPPDVYSVTALFDAVMYSNAIKLVPKYCEDWMKNVIRAWSALPFLVHQYTKMSSSALQQVKHAIEQ